MVKFKLFTIGCKVAQAEGHQAALTLEQFGLYESLAHETPELCVVNTCAVTSAAVGKSRRLIRRLARVYPHSKIIVLGCYASIVDPSIKTIPQVVLIADHHRGIFSALEQFAHQMVSGKSDAPQSSATTQGETPCNTNTIKPFFSPQVKDNLKSLSTQPYNNNRRRQSRHRAFLKVQDGCDARCSYCIIPRLRPKIESVPADRVLEQADDLIRTGHREIVLCGIFLGAYGKQTTRKSRLCQPGYPLADLISRLTELPDLGRLRLSSLEPLDINNELLLKMINNDKIAHHLHLPLQSGSDAVLRRMGRQYRADSFLKAIEQAVKILPELAITTDVIVGFPGETEEDFQKTLDLCRQAKFSKIHIFPFSPRPETPAWEWKDQCVTGPERDRRFEMLQNLEIELARQARDRLLGKTLRVLVEKLEQTDQIWYCQGRADQYFMVRFRGKPEFDNRFFNVKITETDREPLEGELIAEL